MAELNPAQTASTGKATGKYKYEVTKAIADSAGKTLLECIQEGIVEKPTAMSWNTWQQWRRTTSPKEETDGFRQDSTIERRLHLEDMEALMVYYGSQGCHQRKEVFPRYPPSRCAVRGARVHNLLERRL